MNGILEKLVQVVNKRIFVDIAYSGCGSGCKYCYVDTYNKKQLLISEEIISDITDWIIDNHTNNSFISLCPNTEPFKSQESTALVILLLKKLARFGIPFQISTKENVKPSILKDINDMCVIKNQVFFNISMPLISKAQVYEPYAGSIKVRKSMINNIHNFENLTSCIYIKPFLKETTLDKSEFISIINESRPDYVTIGIEFNEANKLDHSTCTSLYRKEIATKLLDCNKIGKMILFAREIEQYTSYNITFSTNCQIINAFNFTCYLKLNQYNSTMCQNCTKV